MRNPIVLNVTQPSITLCHLATPIDFGALDGQPVRVFFSLVSPTVRCHLHLLARLSFALHDRQFKEVVLRQGAAEEVIREAERIEAAVPAAGPGKGAP